MFKSLVHSRLSAHAFSPFAFLKGCALPLEDGRGGVMMSFLSISRRLAFLSPEGFESYWFTCHVEQLQWGSNILSKCLEEGTICYSYCCDPHSAIGISGCAMCYWWWWAQIASIKFVHVFCVSVSFRFNCGCIRNRKSSCLQVCGWWYADVFFNWCIIDT